MFESSRENAIEEPNDIVLKAKTSLRGNVM